MAADPVDPVDSVDPVDTVIVDGRVFAAVDDLVRSYRGRVAVLETLGGMTPDHLGRASLLSRAAELEARADALVVAGLEHHLDAPPLAMPLDEDPDDPVTPLPTSGAALVARVYRPGPV